MKRIPVLHVVSEAEPYAKTGGLADVVSALPRALAKLGHPQTLVLPRYRQINPAQHQLARRLLPLPVPLGKKTEEVAIYEGRLPGGLVQVYLVDHPVFDREGLYGDESGDYGDNGWRFGLLARAALEICHHLDRWPAVVHAHDWQGALALAFAKRGVVAGRPVPATALNIHNLAFRGLHPKSLIEELGLGWDLFNADGAEFYDQLCFLKAGMASADRIITVSPRYAREILTTEHGFDLDGFLRARAERVVGILNGIDPELWDPAHDPHVPFTYEAADRSGKARCKATLQRELGLAPRARTPIFGTVSRLTEQKGYDLITQAGEDLARLDAQFVFLGGSGDRRFEQSLLDLARRFPTQIAVHVGYDDRLAHRVMAGSDFVLLPSRFEPCGLGQLYGMRYGAVPVVRATGGLDDTVVDYDPVTATGNGFKFEDYTPQALVRAVRRAVALAKSGGLDPISAAVMSLDNSWSVSARRYLEIYGHMLGVVPEVLPQSRAA